eukprot:6413450-Prymnesium_polylepis.1
MPSSRDTMRHVWGGRRRAEPQPSNCRAENRRRRTKSVAGASMYFCASASEHCVRLWNLRRACHFGEGHTSQGEGHTCCGGRVVWRGTFADVHGHAYECRSRRKPHTSAKRSASVGGAGGVVRSFWPGDTCEEKRQFHCHERGAG